MSVYRQSRVARVAEDSPDSVGRLQQIDRDIDACTVCSDVPGFVKIRGVYRGERTPVMIVGQGPGSREAASARAFAGPSGVRLEEWLVRCGAPKEAPRSAVYLTSVIKCAHGGGSAHYAAMRRRCRRFLGRQMQEVRPALVITLGKEAYTELRFADIDYNSALCQPYDSAAHMLTTDYGFHYHMLPWPHPSPLNRWHNGPENRERLAESFRFVTPFLTGATS